ncbi:MAG: restriction endonuclease subunit S [Saprospiraceae bacterium]
MSKEKKKTMVPKLRFPEFLDAGEWEEKPLGKVATFLKGKGISKSDIISNGLLPCIRYGELYTYYNETIDAVKSYTNLLKDDLVLSQANDVIIPASGETKEDIATASCVTKSGIALGGDLNIIRTKTNGVFLSYYLNNAKKKEIAQLAQGISVVHLYPGQLQKLKINVPEEPEQQKIASFLTSLDDLITAQSEKMKSLQAHKKGLMQELFPAEGETVPRVRFVEFRDEGKWGIRQLNEFITERSQFPTEKVPLYSLTIENGITPKTERYERSFLVRDEEEAYKLVFPGDFAYNPMNLRFGAIARHAKDNNVALSKYYNIFYCDDSVDARFCELYFTSYGMITHYNNVATGSLIEKRRVHFSDFLKFKIHFPKLPEQQKIALCLSSLDDLITAQSQKLEALKAQKKGLMQQLFPNPNEMEA